MRLLAKKSLPSALLVLPFAITSLAQNPVYRARYKPVRMKVRIVAISSAVHQAYAGNQDTYIAEVLAARDNVQGSYVKLIDRYREYGDPIRHEVLERRYSLDIRVVRDESCDAPARSVYISPAVSDLFQKDLRQVLEDQGMQVVKCFLVEHHATRISKR